MTVAVGGTRNCASQCGAYPVERCLTYAGNQCSHDSNRSDRGSQKGHDRQCVPAKENGFRSKAASVRFYEV